MSQAANNGPRQGAGQQFVKFSRQSAQRIAAAVRHVEQGSRIQPGVEFEHPIPPAKVFRICTFTGTWSKGDAHTVTFLNQTSTVSALNLFATVGTATATRNCAVAKDGTAWYLIAAECG